jgi:hypothetical protein
MEINLVAFVPFRRLNHYVVGGIRRAEALSGFGGHSNNNKARPSAIGGQVQTLNSVRPKKGRGFWPEKCWKSCWFTQLGRLFSSLAGSYRIC